MRTQRRGLGDMIGSTEEKKKKAEKQVGSTFGEGESNNKENLS